MSENRSNPTGMSISEIEAAIGGATAVPRRPEGTSDVPPLNPLGLDRAGAEPAPQTVSAQQGAGSGPGGLTPGAQGSPTAGDGVILVGGNAPDSGGGPEQRPTLSGIASLTAGQINRPEGGAGLTGEPPGGPQAQLAAGGGTGAGLNPLLGRMTPPGQVGPFGKKSL